MNRVSLAIGLALACLSAGCAETTGPGFREDLVFLRRHAETIVLHAPDGPGRVVVCPDLQGRVMTSATGPQRQGAGWINRQAIEAGEIDLRFNDFGGEDRFWLGPEDGPFGLFYPPGKEPAADNWYVPSALDQGRFNVVARGSDRVALRRRMALSNHRGTKFLLLVHRTVRVLTKIQVRDLLGVPLPEELRFVGYVTENTVTNEAPVPMSERTGLLHVWIVGQFARRRGGCVIVPHAFGPAKMLDGTIQLETCSPATRLERGESFTHRHWTIRLEGPAETLDRVCSRLGGVRLDGR